MPVAAVAVRGTNRPPTFVRKCATCRGTSATATAAKVAVTTTTSAVGFRRRRRCRRQGRRIVALERRSGRRRRRQGSTDWLELLLGVVVEGGQRRRRGRGTVLLLYRRMHRRDVVRKGLKSLHRLVALRTLQEAVRLGGAAALVILRQTGCQRWKLQGKLG